MDLLLFFFVLLGSPFFLKWLLFHRSTSFLVGIEFLINLIADRQEMSRSFIHFLHLRSVFMKKCVSDFWKWFWGHTSLRNQLFRDSFWNSSLLHQIAKIFFYDICDWAVATAARQGRNFLSLRFLVGDESLSVWVIFFLSVSCIIIFSMTWKSSAERIISIRLDIQMFRSWVRKASLRMSFDTIYW